MAQEAQANNETNNVESNNQGTREPTPVPQSVKYGGANFYDNHIIRQMPLPSWDSEE